MRDSRTKRGFLHLQHAPITQNQETDCIFTERKSVFEKDDIFISNGEIKYMDGQNGHYINYRYSHDSAREQCNPDAAEVRPKSRSRNSHGRHICP